MRLGAILRARLPEHSYRAFILLQSSLSWKPIDLAGAAAIPTAEKPASFAKSRRENLPSIGFPPQIRCRIKLISGNTVDLEFDRGRRFGIDKAHALEVLRAHR
jgi:hypothetical protein